MALGTMTPVDKYTVSNRRYRVFDIVMSTGANWTAAGESITPAMAGMKQKIVGFRALGPAMNSTPLAFSVGYNYTTNKLIAFGTNAAPGAAVGDPVVTGNTDLSGYTVRVEFEGY